MNDRYQHRTAYQPQHTFLYSDSIAINYEVTGTGNKAILFLHGFGLSIASWNDIRVWFPDDEFKYYFLDLKGFGYSSKPRDGKYSFLDQARIIVAFLEYSALDDVIVVGHSYGGGAALFSHILLKRENKPGRISKLVLIDTAAYDQEMPFFIDFLTTPILNTLIVTLIPARIRAQYVLQHTFKNRDRITDDQVDRYSESFSQKGTSYSFIQAARQIVPKCYQNTISEYLQIDIPTLIIWGDNDPVIPIKNGVRLHEDIPKSRLEVVDNCGHVPHEEWPDITFKKVIQFWRL